MPDPKIVDEAQYGEVQAQEALEQSNPMPEEQAAATPEQIAAQAAAQEEQQGQTDQQAAPAQQGPRRTNQWLIPHDYSQSLPPTGKNRAEQIEDVGMLWEVLAKTSSSPVIRKLAGSMRRRGR